MARCYRVTVLHNGGSFVPIITAPTPEIARARASELARDLVPGALWLVALRPELLHIGRSHRPRRRVSVAITPGGLNRGAPPVTG